MSLGEVGLGPRGRRGRPDKAGAFRPDRTWADGGVAERAASQRGQRFDLTYPVNDGDFH